MFEEFLLSDLSLLHHLHDDGPGPRQDQVADSPVVVTQDVPSIHRHNKLTNLQMDREENLLFLSLGLNINAKVKGINMFPVIKRSVSGAPCFNATEC